MKKLFVSVTLLLISVFVYPQIAFERIYGAIGYNQGFAVVQTSDGGYAVTGNKSTLDVYLLRTNLYGDTLWTKTYGGTANDYGYSIAQTKDDGFIITGGKMIAGYFHVYLIKTNNDGDTLWSKIFGKDNVNSIGNSVIQLSDSGYIISGYTDNIEQGGQCSVYLIRTNANGDTTWTKSIIGNYDEYGYHVALANDSGFVVVGRSMGKICIIRTDNNGDTLWIKTYGGPTDQYGNSVSNIDDGGYIISGATNSFGAGLYDVYLIRINSSGDTIWTRTFGGNDDDFGFSVEPTNDGGFIISGQTKSFGSGSYDVYLIKTDSNGILSWSKTFGGSGFDFGRSAIQTTDDGYIIVGSTESFDVDWRYVYLIKTDANGYIVGIDDQASSMQNRIIVYPNPSNGQVNIQIPNLLIQTKKLEIYNYLGQLQFAQTKTFNKIDISHLTNGIYYLVLTNSVNESQILKIIKE